jgi:hypothetical protein
MVHAYGGEIRPLQRAETMTTPKSRYDPKARGVPAYLRVWNGVDTTAQMQGGISIFLVKFKQQI